MKSERNPSVAVEKRWNGPGLPDAIFSNQRTQFGQILEGLEMKKVWYFAMVIRNIILQLGILFSH
jgi:hypothetical protein